MGVDRWGNEIVGRPRQSLPDPGPAQRMGELLAQCRRASMPWNDRTYRRLALLVLRDMERHEREDWANVFAQTRAWWQDGYQRTLRVRRYLDVR